MTHTFHQLRTGLGFDAHKLLPGCEMHLAGIFFPESKVGLAGHSDGDVVCHAICDALFTACGLGDMGSNYGTSKPEWAGASGISFLSETARRITEKQFQIINVAVQLIGNEPKIGARRTEAEQVMSQALGAPVSLAATTTDSMGFTGQGEGLAAIATALVNKI